jgi:2-oxoglutarate dehydrogenase complex dehydrogenase (E1) component-like enzyme
MVVFTSKALLRHPMAKSSIHEFTENTRFQRLIPEVLHPDPLKELQILGTKSQDKDLVWSGNSRDARLPYSMVSDPQLEPQQSRVSKSAEFSLLPPNKIKTLIFCSGQVYYLLAKARAANQLTHIAIARIEQINPFPFWECKAVIDNYKNLEEVVYCQEESFNSGAWTFVEPRLETCVRHSDWFKNGKGKQWADKFDASRVAGGLWNGKKQESVSIRGGRMVRYAGRDISAAPATGIKKQHAFEEKMLVSEAFFGGKLRMPKSVEQGIPIY